MFLENSLYQARRQENLLNLAVIKEAGEALPSSPTFVLPTPRAHKEGLMFPQTSKENHRD